jgi:hypothetical protein
MGCGVCTCTTGREHPHQKTALVANPLADYGYTKKAESYLLSA